MNSLIKKTFSVATVALVFGFGFATTGWADTSKTNPVTGETETYVNTFTGEATEWNSTANWDTQTTPFITTPYSPALVDGKTVSTSSAIDGWTLRVGAYNNASVTWSGGITKIQASTVGCWLTAADTSKITIASFAGNQLEGSDSAPFKLTSENAGGITWSSGLTSASNTSLPFWYYLKGTGTVVYGGDITVANAQVIKQADVTLSGTSQVSSKTLVTFGSGTTKAFTADATIKVKNSSGDVVKTVKLSSVNSTGTTTLTTSKAIGSCELVQTTTGIVLYWVDGNPSDITPYKPSINVNFTNGNGLSTGDDVGLSGYAVPGTSWNNFEIPNDDNDRTFNTVNAIDVTGASYVASGVSVKVSNHRGRHQCSSLDSASNPLHGYIDEGADKATPTVTITGIPYDHYRVIVYHSTDSANLPFGYDTINGFDFTYVNGVQTSGTASWGSSGADKSAESIGEGANTLVSAVLTGDTVTMVAHRIGGATPSARGCFAAIQVVEYVPEVGENDLEIPVNGDTTYNVDTAKTLSGTVYLTGSGTLTLSGSEKITAATIDVAKDVVLNINADRLDATTFTGAGTVVYTTAPVENKGWTAIGWSGTVWIKNQAVSSFESAKFGNAVSTVRFTGVTGFLQTNTYGSKGYVHTVPLELVDEGNTIAFTYNNGWGGNLVKVNTLKGTGTMKTQGSGAGEHIYIVDASGFTGVFNLTAKSVYVGGAQPAYSDSTSQSGKLEIRSGTTMTVPAGKTWTANGGFVVNGTLNVDGTLASSHTTKAVSGAGTVVFTGRAPTVSGDAWWKNADWTGTVQVKDVTNMVGDSRAGVWLKFNDYGNSGSVVEMNNVTGWLETGYTCTPKIKITGTLYLNNGGSGKASAFKVGTLLGSGTISGDGSAGTVVFNVTDHWSDFTGTIGLNNKCIVFGETIPDELTAGTIYISEGAVVTPQQASGTWWAVGGIKVDGELRAPNLDKFGGGTTITTSDNGVFTLTSTENIQDWNTNYSRIKGTGTLKLYSVSNWRMLSRNNFPTTMTLENELGAGLLLAEARTYASNNLYEIGNLSGTKKIRSDYNNGNRDFRVNQFRDTEWSGVFGDTDRIGTMYVRAGASGAGTLTLSNTQTHDNNLYIESTGSVKITGTWKGATTVAGSLAFGGANGTKIDGAATTSSGAELDFSEFTVGEAAPISGALTLDANTTIKFPAGVNFPYKLAGSFGGSVTSLAAGTYTIGGVAGTVPLMLANGSAYTEARGTISGDCDWASITWENGATPVSGSEVSVSVTADATLSLGVTPVIAMKATFNVPANKTLTLSGALITGEINFTGAGKVVCSAKNTLVGVIKGDADIAVEYPEHTLPIVGVYGADWTNNYWKGTLVLRNCGRGQNANYPSGETHGVVRFDQYGSANSVIRAPGYEGISAVADQNTTCPATLFIDANETVEFNHGTGESALSTNGAGFRFAKLAGTGTLRLDGTSDTAQYIFNDVTAFAGTVEITFPAEGGRKSFLFGAADNWEVMNSAYAANLVILDNMTVAAGKTWDIPAGIIIGAGKTLTLGDGATVKALSKDTEGAIAVPLGTATLQGVSNAVVNANLTIGENATLNITDPSLTTLTIPADSSAGGTYSNAGTLDLSGCTSLTTLHLALGEAKTFDLSKVTLPSTCTTIYYDIGSKRDLTGYTLPASSETVEYAYYATETIGEYANGGFTVSNVAAGSLWLIRQNGALIKTAESGTDRTYAGGRSFAGAACWHEWDFEQGAVSERLKDTGRFSTNEVDYANLVALAVTGADSDANYSTCRVEVQSENKRVLSSAVCPNAEIAFGSTWSAALRCSMPTVTGDGKVVAIAFGDTTSGVLGLAAGADGFMELFTWTSGTYTVLAQLKVESPSDKDNMHLYVFAVNNGTVTFYRDGEFIHTAAFTLSGNLTKFMVGDVANRGAAQNLPSAVGSGGYVDYVRLYDKVLPVEDVEGLSVRRPFVSAIDAYERTASLIQNWSATDAWTWKKGNNAGTAVADAPAAAANVTLSADGQTDMSLNLASDAAYNTLIFGGEGAVGLSQTSTGAISAQMMVVRRGVNLTVDYDAVSLANAVVGVDEGASLAFDFSDYPFDAVTAETNITLAGAVPAVQYDNTCAARYSVVLPDTLPAHITSAAASWDGATYKITITPNHTAGGTVYYKDGALAAGMTVYTDAELTVETKLFAGDTLVISEASSTGAVSVEDTFDGDISVTRAAVSLTSTGTGALAGRTVTVESGKALNFAGGSFGAMTLAGDGTFAFTDDTTAASLSGTVGITVADGKTLTLTAATPFVAGGVSGSGMVKLPAVTGSVDFNTYGNANSTVELTGVTAGALTSGGTCGPALLLDGAATFASVGTYTFTKISGSGNLTFPADSEVTLAELADYTGTIANNSSTAVTVTKLTKTGVFVGGDVLLTKEGSGAVTVSSVEVGGVSKQGVWDGNNYRLAVAQYNGQNYVTIQDAISAAGDAHLAEIEILDGTAQIPSGYYVDEGHLARIVAAVVYATGNPVYYSRVQDAVDAVSGTGAAYDYIEAYVGETVTAVETIKIKPMNEVVVSVYPASDEFTVTAGAPADGVTTYTVTRVPGLYTWNGQVLLNAWDNPEAWLYGNNGSAARRCPGAGDDVVFASDATVSVSEDITVNSIHVGGAVTINNSAVEGVTLSATSGGIVLTSAGGRITLSGVTLSPTPTTTVEGASVVYAQETSTYALWVPSNVTLAPATPVFQDYTNATIVATVTADDTFDAEHATYTATVGGQSYTGTYASGVVTFEIPGSAGASANVTITATPQVGGPAVATVNTSFVFGSAADWFEETAAKFGNSGTWVNATADTTADKIVLSGDDNATFAPTKTMTGNTADVVWVLSFDAPNDEDLSAELDGAQTAFRLSTGSGGAEYVFQLWVGNAWKNVAAADITPEIDREYTVTNHFDYATHTFTVTVNGKTLAAVADGATTFALPNSKTNVASFEFTGAGELTGIAGTFFDTMLYIDGDGMTYATLAAALASGEPVTALNPNMILTVEPGLNLTAPQGMAAANFKPTYKGTSISGYVDVSIVNGKVTLSATDAAKPSATAVTADGIAVGNVKPGLYYWVEASTAQDFTTGKTVSVAQQATTEASIAIMPPTPPEGKVIFYRVAVDAEIPEQQ